MPFICSTCKLPTHFYLKKKKSLVILCEDGLIRANCLIFIHMSQCQWWREIETGKLCWNPCKRKRSCLLWVVQPALHHSQRGWFISSPVLHHVITLEAFFPFSTSRWTPPPLPLNQWLTQPTRKKSKLGEEKMFLFLNYRKIKRTVHWDVSTIIIRVDWTLW